MGLGRARRGDRPSLEEFPTDLTGARKGDIRELAERFGVDFLRLQFTDILGVNKNVEVPPSQFEKALDGEIMFDGSSIEGFVRIGVRSRVLPVREGARRRTHHQHPRPRRLLRPGPHGQG